MGSKVIDLLKALSNACNEHKDELIARAEYYKAVSKDYKQSGKTTDEYFKDNPIELEPVPKALLSILHPLKKLHKNISENALNECIKQLDIQKDFPNIYFLYNNLGLYHEMLGSLDKRYHFFHSIGNGVVNAFESSSQENFPREQIPNLISENETPFDLNKHIHYIALQMDTLPSSSGEKSLARLKRSDLPRETRVRVHINHELVEMRNELVDYGLGLKNEILQDVKEHKEFYSQYFNPKNPLEDILKKALENKDSPEKSHAETKILRTLKKNFKSLHALKENFLPRGEMGSSYVINHALLKYFRVIHIFHTMSDIKNSQQTVIENSIRAIKDALPDLEASRDSRLMNALKHFLCLFFLYIPSLFLFNTKGHSLAIKHLNKLSLFRYRENQSSINDFDSLQFRL